MRINLSISPNSSIVPFDHIPYLTGTIHKWIGQNNAVHGSISQHSFSWLKGGRKGNGGLYFPRGSSFFISAHEEQLIKRIMKGAIDQPELFAGMRVQEIKLQYTPFFGGGEAYFSVASPVLIKKKEADRVKHCLFNDPEANDFLTQSMQKKMVLAGINPNGVSVLFDPDYRSAHTKLVNYSGIMNRASICPVLVKGTSEQIAFAWNVGIGNSTGIGFGALN